MLCLLVAHAQTDSPIGFRFKKGLLSYAKQGYFVMDIALLSHYPDC